MTAGSQERDLGGILPEAGLIRLEEGNTATSFTTGSKQSPLALMLGHGTCLWKAQTPSGDPTLPVSSLTAVGRTRSRLKPMHLRSCATGVAPVHPSFLHTDALRGNQEATFAALLQHHLHLRQFAAGVRSPLGCSPRIFTQAWLHGARITTSPIPHWGIYQHGTSGPLFLHGCCSN